MLGWLNVVAGLRRLVYFVSQLNLAYIHPCPQQGIRGSASELVLHMRNVSSRDNLQNLTCEAENPAGMGEDTVQLDIQCMCWNFSVLSFLSFFLIPCTFLFFSWKTQSFCMNVNQCIFKSKCNSIWDVYVYTNTKVYLRIMKYICPFY